MTSTDTCYLTVTQAAEAAGYSRAHFYRLVLQGRISGAVKIGRD